MFGLSREPKCTCSPGMFKQWFHVHHITCDLLYVEGKSQPRKKKRFWIFYPLKKA